MMVDKTGRDILSTGSVKLLSRYDKCLQYGGDYVESSAIAV